MSTRENLQEAFAGESQANRKYLAFAAAAEKEGLPQIAKLFRAVAEAETVHALAHFKVLEGVQKTEENLKAALAGEEHEFKSMYPAFLAEAKQEQNKKAEVSIQYAMAVEETHYGLYGNALKAVQTGQDLPESTVHVCRICGHTVLGDAPDRCPVCNARRDAFSEVK